jgi:hypothetical protein
MRTLSAVLIIATSQFAIASNPQDSDAKTYVKRTYGPVAVGRSAVGATLAQGTDTPQEWGQGAAGFGRRFASAFGQHIIKKSIEYPVAKLRHEPFGYRPSDKNGFKSRLLYALMAVVITHKTTDGSRTVHSAEISGDFGAGLLSRLWQPASTRTLAAGFGSAGAMLAADAGYNVLREFWPEIRHPHSHEAARGALLERIKSRDLRDLALAARRKNRKPNAVDPHNGRDAGPPDIEPSIAESDREDN